MEQIQFEQMVARIERDSVEAPKRYQFRVAMLTLLGFGVLAVVVSMAGLGLIALLGIVVALALTGFKVAIVLLKLGKLLILLAWPMWVLVKSSVQALFVRLPRPQGHEITEAQAPALFAAMHDMRRRMKGPRFHHVLVTNELNAAVVQRPLFGLIGWPRNYLILGLPLLESLSPQEALAVVAHEYGHLAGSHSRFGAYIYRLRNSWGTIQALTEQWEGWANKPLKRLVSWYAPYFNAYTFVLARANEYQADAASAELVGADVAASALKRVHLASASYDQFMGKVFDGIREQPQPPADMARRWAEQAGQGAALDTAQKWLRQALDKVSDVSDTHPALSLRLKALPAPAAPDGGLQEALPAPLNGTSAAQTWLGASLGALRKQIQDEWQQRVAQPWSERFEAIQGQRKRLAELEALSEPSADDRIEMVRLRMQLDPDTDHRPALRAFNEAHADHALGLFLEGDHLLDKDDEAGLALLERAMGLDPTAIKPACELAFRFWHLRHEPERAQAYKSRWQEREALEQRQRHELSNMDLSHELRRPSELAPEAMDKARRIVRTQAKGLKQAHLLRRMLPSAPEIESYVLVLEPRLWTRLRRKQGELVIALARHEWPMHVLVCTTQGANKPLKDKAAALSGSALL